MRPRVGRGRRPGLRGDGEGPAHVGAEGVEAGEADELDELGAKAIGDYVAAHPKGQFGAHRYDVAEFGLDAGELAERFAAYIDRYDVPRESRVG